MASTISAQQARAIFTSMCIDVYNDMLAAPGFLRSFFPSVQEFTRYVSIQVERDLELMAVDVMRHSGGNVNKFSKSTEKVVDPPFYNEIIFLNEMDGYDRAFGSTQIDKGFFSTFVAVVARRLNALRNKVFRAIEKQCADVLQTGVITLVSGDSINYRRKSASLVAYSSGINFADNANNPFTVMGTGIDFVRQVGKSSDVIFNIIFGNAAYAALTANTNYTSRVTQNLNNNIDLVNAPQQGSTGYSFHGQLTVGSNRANIFTYNQTYDVVSGSTVTPTQYIGTNNIIVLPTNTRFKTAYAAVPKVPITDPNSVGFSEASLDASQFVIDRYIDPKHKTDELSLQSAPVVVPTAIDQMWTATVLS